MCSTTVELSVIVPSASAAHQPQPAARRVRLHLPERPVRRARRQAEAAVGARVDQLALDHRTAKTPCGSSSARSRSSNALGSDRPAPLSAAQRTSSQIPARPAAAPISTFAAVDLSRRPPRELALEQHRDALVRDVERARHERRPTHRSRLRLRIARRHHGCRGLRQRVQPQAHPHDDRERAARAREELAKVVAGDVLHHLAARARDEPVAEDGGDAQHQVAQPRRSGDGAGRERSPARHAPSVGSPGGSSESRLAVLGERRLERREPDAGLDRAREVACLVLEDPVERTQSRGRRRSVDRDAAALGVPRARRPRPQRRSARPSLSSGCWRYGPGTSPQRRGVGNSLPGFAIPAGSKARRTRCHRLEVVLAEEQRHRARLVGADAVLAGDRAAGVDAGDEDRAPLARAPARPRPRRASS